MERRKHISKKSSSCKVLCLGNNWIFSDGSGKCSPGPALNLTLHLGHPVTHHDNFCWHFEMMKNLSKFCWGWLTINDAKCRPILSGSFISAWLAKWDCICCLQNATQFSIDSLRWCICLNVHFTCKMVECGKTNIEIVVFLLNCKINAKQNGSEPLQKWDVPCSQSFWHQNNDPAIVVNHSRLTMRG